MEQNPTKKEEFTKQKQQFAQKFDGQLIEAIKFIKSKQDTFDKQASAELQITDKKNLATKGVILNSESIKTIQSKLQEFKKENPDAKLFEHLSFNETVQKGDKFCPIEKLKCVFEDKEETLEHKDGIVYLVDFWATWCGPCQRPMQHNQEMLEKNQEKWKDKIQIYGVSLDESIDDVKKRVDDKKWHLIKHYQIPNEDAIKCFEVDGIPTIYIIDQHGTIVYNGHPMSINVEEVLNNLVEKGVEEKKQKEKLSKEKFKEMKTEIQKFLKEAITKEDKFTLKITFKKKKIFDHKWNILEKKYHNPTLSYVVKQKQNDKFQQILSQLFQKYPKSQFKIKKEQIINNALQRENCIKFATSQLQEQGLTSIPSLDLKTQIKLKFANRIKQGIVAKTAKLDFGSTKPFPPSQADQVKKFNEAMQDFKSKAKFKEDVQVIRGLVAQSKIAVEDDFFPFKGYKINISAETEKKEDEQQKEEAPKEKEIVSIEHKSGEVLLIDFWATWCPPCQQPMNHNQEMLVKHKEDWGNKVRIIAASLDQDESAVIKRAQEKKWLDMEYVILNNEEFQQAPRMYGIRGIPFIVIVNKQGKIKYMGHPSQIQVEEYLQKMLDEKDADQEEKKQEEVKTQKGLISQEQFNQLIAIQKEYLLILREKVKDEKYAPTFSLKIMKLIKYDLKGQIIGQPQYIAKQLLVKMYEKQFHAIKEFQEILEKIEKIVKKEDFEIEYKLELEKTITIEFGKECDNCKKSLSQSDKQYYCHFHKIWFCYECGNKIDDSKKGNAKYLHPCNMVYINVINDSGMKDIDEYKFGKNIQYEEDSQIHSYCCNGCSGGGTERYICLTCRPGPMRPGGFVDICEHCTKILEERNLESDAYIKTKKNVMDENHDEQTHILLRIIFGKGNYYKY